MVGTVSVGKMRSKSSSPSEYRKGLEETAEILSDPDAIAALEEGLGEIERGETVTLAELRKELAAARPTSD